MAPRYSEEDSQLITLLHKLSATSKLVKSNQYAAPADPNVAIRSWKMDEFKYYVVPSPFPTLARGLFTTKIDDGDGEHHRIVVRGYDKFFNIGEVPWTNWEALKACTAAPYTLTSKSRGCIIFIGALFPAQILVTSKQSGLDAEKSHAVVGERWLDKHLASRGRSKEELAKTLWDKNLTAIAELCDDNFEEHVLGYPPEQTGLQLLGLNMSTKAFHTLPPADVDAFAREWGFIVTKSIELPTIEEVQRFTDEAGKTGSWNGEPIEGFVVRTHVVDPPPGEANKSATPYAPGSTFFFKVKFDEPYMMYRDWREVTKKLLSAKEKGQWHPTAGVTVTLPRKKMQRPETKLYVEWVKREIMRNPADFVDYTKGKGIIAARERFLKWMETDESKKHIEEGNSLPPPMAGANGKEIKEFGKTIIVPIAIPGCGKTTVAVALSHLFGFGHTQSDDVKVKKAAPVFLRNVAAELRDHEVVIADKNNHLRQHREQLKDLAAKMNPPARLLALNWQTDQPPAILHRIMGDRIVARGDNHQSLLADDTAARAHEEVIWLFITKKEELEPEEEGVHEVIEMSIDESLEDAVRKAADGCARVLGLKIPTQEQIDEAVRVALRYAPTTQGKKSDAKKSKTKATPRYFGLLPEIDLLSVLGSKFEGQDTTFWDELVKRKAVTKRPHVTVTHGKSLLAETELWERCMALHGMVTPPRFRFKLGQIMWNDRVMGVTVDELQLVEGGEGQEGADFISKLPKEVSDRMHITVGTREGVPAVETMELVNAWRDGQREGVHCIELQGVEADGRVKGLY
ncbi:hypothetical protein FIBSPDRAFT_766407 [Athelia psychrophila]|uniref:tRNA ligase n=1 Tax=Athelia psychrophila TaxID=1759441 RepID=A0A167VJ96_9AGAM|nr:hypothetical protein FIBSPDRAFT_766407 [Fibularhizoctonia sp. CBS 109695]